MPDAQRQGTVEEMGCLPLVAMEDLMPSTPPSSGADRSERELRQLPSALPVRERFGERVRGKLAVFLDYDGTLTPIVDDPDDALLSDEMRAAISELTATTLVAIVSGRDLEDVREKVAIDGLAYAGSHGFDIRHPDGSSEQLAVEALGALDSAQATLEERVGEVEGARVERKRFAIAVHDRQVDDPAERQRLAHIVEEVGSSHEELRSTGGKRVHELRPDIDWDKGRAIEMLLAELDAEDHVPIYVGDDLTDEDGFRVVVARGGIAVVVRGEDDERGTLADAALEATAETGRFLAELAEVSRQEGASHEEESRP
ncbi:MAG: trehalose-phosphatase [Nitriliruptoraceae bacterium]